LEIVPLNNLTISRRSVSYRWETASPDGFVRQVVQHVSSGHHFYFTDRVKEHVDLEALDDKLIDTYRCDVKPWTRSRRKASGMASTHYVRHGRYFILLATAGQGSFFESLGESRDRHGRVVRPAAFRDMRRISLVYNAYSIRHTFCRNSRVIGGVRVSRPGWHTLVRLNKQVNAGLRAHMLELATRWPKQRLEAEFWSLGFYPFRPVIDQLLATVRAVNRKRQSQGMAPLDHRKCVRRRRPAERVFVKEDASSPV